MAETARTADDTNEILLPALDIYGVTAADSIAQLSAHDKKEAQIYDAMAHMPSRHIQLVEQKTEE